MIMITYRFYQVKKKEKQIITFEIELTENTVKF